MSVFSFTVFILTMTPKYYAPEKRRLRGTMFLILGISAGVPVIHLALLGDKIIGFDVKPYLIYWYLGGIIYVLGGVIYVIRLPEKFFPNKFDYCGSSHNILHTCVLFGFLFHYLGALDSYYYRLNNRCPA